jgi:hypothetical protein
MISARWGCRAFTGSAPRRVYGVTQVTSGSPTRSAGGYAFFTTAPSVAWPWLIVLWIAYYLVPEGLLGGSLGKLLTGLCVERVDGRPPGNARSLTRPSGGSVGLLTS